VDAVTQQMGSCKVLVVEANSRNESEHWDLVMCGISCCCPAEGQRPLLADLNAKSCSENAHLFSSQEK